MINYKILQRELDDIHLHSFHSFFIDDVKEIMKYKGNEEHLLAMYLSRKTIPNIDYYNSGLEGKYDGLYFKYTNLYGYYTDINLSIYVLKELDEHDSDEPAKYYNIEEFNSFNKNNLVKVYENGEWLHLGKWVIDIIRLYDSKNHSKINQWKYNRPDKFILDNQQSILSNYINNITT